MAISKASPRIKIVPKLIKKFCRIEVLELVRKTVKITTTTRNMKKVFNSKNFAALLFSSFSPKKTPQY